MVLWKVVRVPQKAKQNYHVKTRVLGPRPKLLGFHVPDLATPL
jgi:hypothetical protein